MKFFYILFISFMLIGCISQPVQQSNTATLPDEEECVYTLILISVIAKESTPEISACRKHKKAACINLKATLIGFNVPQLMEKGNYCIKSGIISPYHPVSIKVMAYLPEFAKQLELLSNEL